MTKFWGSKFGPNGSKLGLKFASLLFLDIAQDSSLGQCLASSRAETSKKKFVAQIRAKQTQMEAEMRFSSIFFLLY